MPKNELTKMQKIRERLRGPSGDLVSRKNTADLVGCSAHSIGNYENRKERCASMAIRRAIAGGLGVNVETIFDSQGWAR